MSSCNNTELELYVKPERLYLFLTTQVGITNSRLIYCMQSQLGSEHLRQMELSLYGVSICGSRKDYYYYSRQSQL
jgi:hypothetical protein